MSILAIYGCCNGHSSPIPRESREGLPKTNPCAHCSEEAYLFDVMSVQPNRFAGWTVVDGGKP